MAKDILIVPIPVTRVPYIDFDNTGLTQLRVLSGATITFDAVSVGV